MQIRMNSLEYLTFRHLRRPTLQILIRKLDEKIETLASSPDDAQGKMAYDRTVVVHLERLVYLCRYMSHEHATFEGCK